jgi:CheY-like chemotaxis protein
MKGSGKRWKVLVIEDDSSRTSLLATFLASMGCQCRGTTSGFALAILEQQEFDAVLLDLQCSEARVEELISNMEDMESNLWRRMVVIFDDDIDPQITKLLQGLALAGRIPRSCLFQELWPSLQLAFASWQWRTAARYGAQIAQLVFDSFRQPLPAGVRTLRAPSRQLVYEYGKVKVDMVLDPLKQAGRMALVGQVLNLAEPGERSDSLQVALRGPEGRVDTARTNQFGEFSLEVAFIEDADLEITVEEDFRLVLPLGNRVWVKSAFREPQAADLPPKSGSPEGTAQ